MLEIEYELHETDLTAFTEHQMQEKEDFQKILRRHEITFPAFLALIAAFVGFYYANLPGAVYIAIIAILWHYFSPYTIKSSIRRRALKLYSVQDKAKLIGHYKLRVEPQVLVVIHGKKEEPIPWRDIIRIDVTKRYVFIILDLDMALIIPRKGIKGNLDKFLQIANKRIAEFSN